MRYRLAVLTSHVIQYQDPLFRQLAQHPEIDLTVLFCSRMGAESYLDRDLGVELRWDLELLQGYRYRYLRNFAIREGGGFWARLNPGVFGALVRGGYDAVLVMGWGSPTAWLAFLTCRLLGRPYFISGDNCFIVDPPTLRGKLRHRALRWLFTGAGGLMLMGTMNIDFYAHFGAQRRQFYPMPYAIDNNRFFAASRMTPETRAALRAELGVAPDRTLFLFSGKLISRKEPLHLLQAYERMALRDSTAIAFMGEGAERPTLEKYAQQRNLSHAHFFGFVNQLRMPMVYGASDAFVLPSAYDPRGTVVNEAMACGLPIVISDRVGVFGEGDIVREGENGFVFPVGDVDRLAAILDTLAGDEALRSRMGARSLEIISTWNYEADVAGILAALRATVVRTSESHLEPAAASR